MIFRFAVEKAMSGKNGSFRYAESEVALTADEANQVETLLLIGCRYIILGALLFRWNVVQNLLGLYLSFRY